MRSTRWVLAAGFLMLCAALAHADGITPPDGNIGIKGGSGSESITTLTFTGTFCIPISTGCPALPPADGNPQAYFEGKNDTGIPWTFLDLTITFPSTPSGAELIPIGCDGGTAPNNFFSILGGACGTTITTSTTAPTVVMVDFSKGTGIGISCFDPNDSSADAACGSFNPNGPTNGGVFPAEPCIAPAEFPNEVCGNFDFLIVLGFNGMTFPTLPDPTFTGVVGATPEPSSLMLFGTGFLGLLGLARKKLRA
jgi:hypothetical protein